MSLEGNSAPILSLGVYLGGMKAPSGTSSVGFQEQPNRILVVPPWQREYVWSTGGDGEVATLLKDLKSFVDSNESDYLMGSILLSHGNSENTNERLVIDGQQRTLTFSILLLCILKHVQNKKKEIHHLGSSEMNNQEDETLTILRYCVSSDINMYGERISMPHSKANETLLQLFQWSRMADGEESDLFTEEKSHWTQTQKNLVDVALWIYNEKLKNQEWIANSDLLLSVRKILLGVKFLQVTLTSEKEAISIFDRINSRGASLNSGDLVKNRIFQSVNDEDFQKVSKYWLEMSEWLAQCSLKRMKEPKFLLRALALSNIDEIEAESLSEHPERIDETYNKITYEHLTDYWGERLEPNGPNSNKVKKIDPLAFAQELSDSSEFLHSLSIEKNSAGESLRELYFSRFLGSVQHFPILLAGRSISDPNVLKHLVRQVHNRTTYYLLSEERTQAFESMVPLWTKKVASLGATASIADLDEIYTEHITFSVRQLDDLMEQMRLWSYIKSDKKKIRAVLAQLTRILDAAGGVEDPGSPNSYFSTTKDDNQLSWDIDHILPRKNNSKDPSLHTIGNLVLLKYNHNRLKGASTPIEKRDVYAGSHVLLTQTLVGIGIESERKKVEKFLEKSKVSAKPWDLSNWDQNSIKSREDFYCDLLRSHMTSFS